MTGTANLVFSIIDSVLAEQPAPGAACPDASPPVVRIPPYCPLRDQPESVDAELHLASIIADRCRVDLRAAWDWLGGMPDVYLFSALGWSDLVGAAEVQLLGALLPDPFEPAIH